VEYACGYCGAALMRVDQSKPHVLMIHRTSFDSYNFNSGLTAIGPQPCHKPQMA
jgi:hypothetical protein